MGIREIITNNTLIYLNYTNRFTSIETLLAEAHYTFNVTVNDKLSKSYIQEHYAMFSPGKAELCY